MSSSSTTFPPSSDPPESTSSSLWQDTILPIVLLLVAHLALGFATELFHHTGSHVGLRE